MAFSKFDPHLRGGRDPEGTTPAATRRAMLLRWGNFITFLMTLFGFLLIVYWLQRS